MKNVLREIMRKGEFEFRAFWIWAFRITSSLETQQKFRNVSQLTDKNGSREKYEAFAKAMLFSWWIAQ